MAIPSKAITWRGKNRGFTEASDLGWRAGQWPLTCEVKSGRTGKVVPFQQAAYVRKHGELEGVRYVGDNDGRLINLMVFND